MRFALTERSNPSLGAPAIEDMRLFGVRQKPSASRLRDLLAGDRVPPDSGLTGGRGAVRHFKALRHFAACAWAAL